MMKNLIILLLLINFPAQSQSNFDYKWNGKKLPIDTLYSFDKIKDYLISEGRKIQVINFWYSHCAPCISEIPALNKLVEDSTLDEVGFISISYENKEESLSFVERYNFRFRNHHLNQDVINQNRLTISYPTTLN